MARQSGMSPRPGDPCPGFVAQVDRCWRMVYSNQLQATHCRAEPSWTGRWFSPQGDRWIRVWACPDHLRGANGAPRVRPATRQVTRTIRVLEDPRTVVRVALRSRKGELRASALDGAGDNAFRGLGTRTASGSWSNCQSLSASHQSGAERTADRTRYPRQCRRSPRAGETDGTRGVGKLIRSAGWREREAQRSNGG